jgi:hypothetical protein
MIVFIYKDMPWLTDLYVLFEFGEHKYLLIHIWEKAAV